MSMWTIKCYSVCMSKFPFVKKQTAIVGLFLLFPILSIFCQNYCLPFYNGKEQIIFHTGFALQYSEQHEQPLWVAYKLTPNMIDSQLKRSNKFKEDPQVITQSATIEDYKYSGYDRGHLAPAGDMKGSYKMHSDSFYLSNVSPQLSEFNQGIWHNLEKWVRAQAHKYQTVYVATGPIFTLSKKLKGSFIPTELIKEASKFAYYNPPIGENKVTVPFAFYKAIIVLGDNPKAIAFLIPQTASAKDSIFKYTLSIDQLEELTGIDFFYQIPTELQESLEAKKSW